jgi:2-polyprenyl-6-hydroxyphenyl methylase/3-demethylubiquinone-9 3-methyltransferase
LKWFELQSEVGLLGEIDYEKTKEGVIVCKDGFTATTVGPEDFSKFTKDINLWCELWKSMSRAYFVK